VTGFLHDECKRDEGGDRWGSRRFGLLGDGANPCKVCDDNAVREEPAPVKWPE